MKTSIAITVVLSVHACSAYSQLPFFDGVHDADSRRVMQQARERIDGVRKGDFTLTLVDDAGQVYVINNALPLSTKMGGRSLLAISLSRDGLIFDRMAMIRFVAPALRYEGRSKSIGYAYPHSVVAGNHLWLIYSVNKEDIEIARIPLSELEGLK